MVSILSVVGIEHPDEVSVSVPIGDGAAAELQGRGAQCATAGEGRRKQGGKWGCFALHARSLIYQSS